MGVNGSVYLIAALPPQSDSASKRAALSAVPTVSLLGAVHNVTRQRVHKSRLKKKERKKRKSDVIPSGIEPESASLWALGL